MVMSTGGSCGYGDPRSAAELAEQGREAIRALNHATFPGRGEIEDVYRVIGSLAALLDGMPQALQQIAAWVVREHRAGRISADSLTNADASQLAGAINALLGEASSSTAIAARRLGWAQESASHVVVDNQIEM